MLEGWEHPGSLRLVFPVGGIEVMLLASALSGLACLGLGLLLGRAFARAGGERQTAAFISGLAIGLLLWSLVVIAIVTLLPTSGSTGWVPAETRRVTCSWDYGGPAPDGFWIFSGGQRLLNTVLFVPSGALIVLAVARWRAGLVLAPLGLVLLGCYSILIEKVQLDLARLDRACDITDVVDNVTGAAIGFGIGLVMVLLLRPWRGRPLA